MKKISEHVQHIHAHIQQHHKKYLFGVGVALGIGITKVMLVITAFFGVSFLGGYSSASGGAEEKALLVFYQIEGIAKQRDLFLHEIGKEHFAIWEVNFHKLEEAFHQENDLIGKFKLAQKLDDLLHWQDSFADIKKNDLENEQFHTLEGEFDALYNHEKSISRTKKSDVFKDQALSLFTQLQQTAEKRDEIMHLLGIDNFLIWENAHTAYTSKFVITSDIKEKYDLSKDISNLLYWQDEYFKEKGYIGSGKYITDEEEAVYQQMQDAFQKLN